LGLDSSVAETDFFTALGAGDEDTPNGNTEMTARFVAYTQANCRHSSPIIIGFNAADNDVIASFF
jgi:hypothetical protein